MDFKQRQENIQYLLIKKTHKFSDDNWIVVANQLQITYGGGLAESKLNSHYDQCGFSVNPRNAN